MWHDIDQTRDFDEWWAMRAGKVGGSSLGKIMANYGKAFGDPAKKLAVNLAIEQITREPLPSGFSNQHTERGHEQEPIANQLYSDMFFCDVTNGGFYDNGKTSVSPDGLVFDDGMIEIKCVIASVQFETIKRGGIDPKYKWQCAFELKESGRDWLDYVSYCSEFPEGKRLYVHRITRGDCTELFSKIDIRLAEFWPLVEANKKIIMGI